MTSSEKRMLNGIISERVEIAHNQLKQNIRYQNISEQQKQAGVHADEILNKLEKDENIAVRRYYEYETEKLGIGLNEIYLQGLRDGVKILAVLGVFGKEGC